MAGGEPVGTPGERLDIRDYLDLALRSGFPEALSIRGAVARQRWLEGYVAQIITRDPTGTAGARDPLRLSRYLEAYALNSARITEAKTIYEAAGIDRGQRVPMRGSWRTSSSSSLFPHGGPTG
jgi:predicted AAA+ superfamily ATPase